LSNPVVVDLRAVQIPGWRGRGAARYAYELALAFENYRPDLVCRYLLAPELAPPGDVNELLRSGKIGYAGEPDWLPSQARVFLSLSPLQPGCRPPEVEHRGLAYAATVTDLIPLRLPEELPSDPWRRLEYRGRASLLCVADAVLCASEATRNDVVNLAGVDRARTCTIGMGRPRQSTTAGDLAGALARARALVPGLRGAYVLCPAGPSPRKNVGRLLEAFARLPDRLGGSRQLVVCSELGNTAAALADLAGSVGIAGRLLMPGQVTEATLEALYQAADVVCLPSLAEGTALTVAEAMGCGAVVVASDISPLDEYVAPEGRFDPTDTTSVSRVLTRALSDGDFRRANGRLRSWRSWEDVAEEAAKVLEHLGARPGRPWRKAPRVAIVSPFPPVMSGIAGYTDRLVEALLPALAASQPGAELDCYADGRQSADDQATLRGGREWRDARSFLFVERALGGYDRVVYVLGNSQYHAGALACLRRRPGIVMAHDVRTSGLLRLSGLEESVPGGLAGAIRRAYGPNVPVPPSGSEVDPVDMERYGLLMMKDVIASAEKVLVSSEAARRLAAVDVGPEFSDRLAVLPFAIALDPESLTAIGTAREAPKSTRPLVASFGIVDQAKQPQLLLRAAALIDAELMLVGPVSEVLRAELTELAGTLGIADRVTIAGQVSRPEYLGCLGRADIAVQLRACFYGESSAAVGECLAAGLPTIVSDLGWMAELPESCVRRIHPRSSEAELADAVGRLLAEPLKRATLGRRAAEFASQQTFAAAASALLAELDLSAS
jgi:glycosyltransferase involved in cell wall biosynthesis